MNWRRLATGVVGLMLPTLATVPAQAVGDVRPASVAPAAAVAPVTAVALPQALTPVLAATPAATVTPTQAEPPAKASVVLRGLPAGAACWSTARRWRWVPICRSCWCQR